jgi:hypothetical protein
MKLTNKMRTEILNQAIASIFEKKLEPLLEKSKKLAMAVYQSRFKKDMDALKTLKLSHNWLTNYRHSMQLELQETKDKTISFDLWFNPAKGGYRYSVKGKDSLTQRRLDDSVAFNLGDALPMPGHTNRIVLTIAEEKIALPLRDEGCALAAEEVKLRAELTAFLAACKTKAEVLANWPEGEQFLPAEVIPMRLPIPLIDSVRAAQGAVTKVKKRVAKAF